ncbi:hypothetical protein PUN28_016033 [Cardiocondyla obscurior]|uniref:J domain-containing protein n=1 Tax=Cardiocondyla obscurior TaxID=286306 RepID=A0AAW2EUG2_9HYME
MAQFRRVCKSEICCVARSYGTQRFQQNHYETLDVSSKASQKEIRQAFIKLSKKLHPDTSGKQGHTDFVKLNEAYTVLGKENTRRQYDLDLKYQKYQPSYTHNSQYAQYGSQWEYEVRSAGGPWPPPQQPKSQLGFIIAMICFGLGLLQFIVMLYSLKVRKFVILRNAQIENNYENIRNAERIKTNTSAIKDLDSLEDLGKYLTEDSN